MSTSDAARLARRYPKRTLFDYLLFGGLGLGVLATIAVAAISGVVQSNPPVAAMVRSFEVVSPTSIEVELVVQRKDPSQEAQCALHAQAPTYEEVAEATFTIPPDSERIRPYTFALTTVKEATAVEVERCWITAG